MRKKELLSRLAEREARIAQLEQRVETMDGLIEGYHSRESAIVSALTHAHETAADVVAQAEARAARIREEAETAADALRASAEAQAQERLEQARRQSAQLLAQAEAAVAEYETTIAAYNTALERAAAEAAESAERFAAFSRNRRIGPSGLSEEVEGLHELPFAKPEELPDPSGDPAQLMRNIYQLQNRVPPEGGFPSAPQSPEQGAPEPREPDAAAPEPPGQEPPAAAPEPEQPGAREPEGGGPEAAETAAPADGDGDEGPVPTVNGVLPGSGCGVDDATLDELLEEIIQAGERNDG